MNHSQGVSVIICCYNSAALIRNTLKHIALQEYPTPVDREIILVDNNCTDHTATVAREEWERLDAPDTPLIIVEEKRPGLSFARRTGVDRARYSCIIFCDDDNLLSASYVQHALLLMKTHADVGAAGGYCEATSDSVLPAWWSEYEHGYACGRQAEQSGDCTHHFSLWGAGLVVRKHIMQLVFDERFPSLLTDRKGEELSSGGDSEICARIVLLGYRLWYDEKLRLKHFISSRRLTTQYRDALFEGHKKALPVLSRYGYIIIQNKLAGWQKIKRTIKLATVLLNPFYKADKGEIKTALNAMWLINLQVSEKYNQLILAFLKQHSRNK